MTDIQVHGAYLVSLGRIMFKEGRNAPMIEHGENYEPLIIAHMVKMGVEQMRAALYVQHYRAHDAINAQF